MILLHFYGAFILAVFLLRRPYEKGLRPSSNSYAQARTLGKRDWLEEVAMGVIRRDAARSAASTLEAQSFVQIIAVCFKQYFARRSWPSIAAGLSQS